ncbi:right-handed parallel beta-helix repeat-containing protein [Gammaproteobacteria bacterium]|jgi:parallel beta-helix repeat protein|nr:right-handed parallel beta-helix repeat-containing protein [Gammaproteobacteria bacterium]MDC1251650.1 right-handed parallel beta-helix repeat-containing protein [Gammaproteobacteria bacterium]MDC3323866.1 right-handed parallel beta-helix repeat-containing protein [Gammaproteobacteria bacterium]|tara:strand:+ start:523 stop:1737 length:1215 start_codon:yes stop_codon:yes gene_type:complete
MQNLLLITLLVISSLSLSSKQVVLGPSSDSQEEIQEALIDLEPGDVLTLKSGEYFFEDGISLDVDDVIFEGSGINETILNFGGQVSGAQGLLVTSNGVTIRDFAVLDAKGDAIKVIGADGINMVRLRTEWQGGPKETNGAYGFYPVESKNVLIDGCVAIGASDAGIYVGQSQHIIVKNSIAQYNVAGIEIENSFYADVFDNIASHNTGGILIFDLPDLPQQGGHHVRVFRNKAINNDTDNFAPEGNIVGEVPRGTGIIIQANSEVEVFDNDIYGNGTVNLSIVTYGYETEDENYNPHPKSIQIHGNRFGEGGFDPDVETGELASILFALSEGDMPDIFWDGILPTSQLILGQPDNEKLVMSNNGDATFLTLNPIKYMLPFFDPVERDIAEYDGEIRPLPPVVLN